MHQCTVPLVTYKSSHCPTSSQHLVSSSSSPFQTDCVHIWLAGWIIWYELSIPLLTPTSSPILLQWVTGKSCLWRELLPPPAYAKEIWSDKSRWSLPIIYARAIHFQLPFKKMTLDSNISVTEDLAECHSILCPSKYSLWLVIPSSSTSTWPF